jgi:hypothetical protein
MSKEARELAQRFGVRMCDENGMTHGEELYCLGLDDIIAMKEALAKQEQGEPVAWGFQNTSITGSNRWMMLREEVPANDQYGGALWTPLYTTPQQRKPLTDEQIKEALADMSALQMPFNKLIPSIARAIEAAHGIKE